MTPKQIEWLKSNPHYRVLGAGGAFDESLQRATKRGVLGLDGVFRPITKENQPPPLADGPGDVPFVVGIPAGAQNNQMPMTQLSELPPINNQKGPGV